MSERSADWVVGVLNRSLDGPFARLCIVRSGNTTVVISTTREITFPSSSLAVLDGVSGISARPSLSVSINAT